MERLGTVLIVDDDALVLEALKQTFMDDYRVVAASTGEEAVAVVKSDHDLDTVVLDIRMAKMDGLQTARLIRQISPELPIIFHTGYPGEYSESRIEKDHQPFDYVGKNEQPERLVRAVKNAVSFYRLKTNSANLVGFARQQFGMVGKSRAMQEVYQTIEKIAPTDNKVMILGQTGTGKELVARAIHKRSRRAGARLVILNCNHKPPDLVESELFGHLRGSFTGAIADRMGLLEYADGGTLFLDEVGDLDMTTQAKLLRVIETGEMQRIGSPEVAHVNVRCMCATNRDLAKLVDESKFREDLFYRLKGVTITIPPLKQRREDIPDLIDFFVEDYTLKGGDGIKIFEPAARDLLVEYDWPGNVRQLLDTVQSLIDLSFSSFITRQEVEDYLAHGNDRHDSDGSFHDQVREFKRILVIQALARNNNNVSAAARELSLDPSNLRKMIKDLGLSQS
jgi:two-component system nitrogen regulation response regulator NtrX